EHESGARSDPGHARSLASGRLWFGTGHRLIAMPLLDSFGRVADDLRVSVTDRCNLRCAYCMPPEGMPWLPRSEILTYEEIDRLVGVFMTLGVRTVTLTGGEPLARRHLPTLGVMLSERAVPDLL